MIEQTFNPSLSVFKEAATCSDPFGMDFRPSGTGLAGAPCPVRPCILLIDDEPLHLDLLADILAQDFEILFSSEGITGLETATCKTPHLILLDVTMPGIDGYEVFRRLKADRRTNEIPVIFITGLNDVSAETKGLKLGAADYITKPINPELLRARVKTQVRLKLALDNLTQLAATDGLTGLANRSHFDQILAYECARHKRSGTELSLILLDVDEFKSFNDSYGHVSGDACLRQVSLAIREIVVRATDLVARYGGEEFVVLLPETGLKRAVTLAERIRKCINDLALPHGRSRAGHVTASLGVASSRCLQDSQVSDIVERADSHLYSAKGAGRNRVAFGSEWSSSLSTVDAGGVGY